MSDIKKEAAICTAMTQVENLNRERLSAPVPLDGERERALFEAAYMGIHSVISENFIVGKDGEYTYKVIERGWKLWQARAALQPATERHADDMAVDKFAVAMKLKMAVARAKGRAGWDDPDRCSADRLRRMLNVHIDKGDPVDVGNFAMMLFNRGEKSSLSDATPVPAQPATSTPYKIIPAGRDGHCYVCNGVLPSIESMPTGHYTCQCKWCGLGIELLNAAPAAAQPTTIADEAAKENAIQQAKQWAQEAKTQRSTVISILRMMGLPENDYEAESLVREYISEQPAIDAQKVRDDALEEAKDELQKALIHYATIRQDGKNMGNSSQENIADFQYHAVKDCLVGIDELKSQPAPLSNSGEAKPFMYAIQDPVGDAHMDEFCVSPLDGDLDETVDSLNEKDEYDEGEGYKVVPVYLHPPEPPSKPQLSGWQTLGGDVIPFAHPVNAQDKALIVKVVGITPGMGRIEIDMNGDIPAWADLGCELAIAQSKSAEGGV